VDAGRGTVAIALEVRTVALGEPVTVGAVDCTGGSGRIWAMITFSCRKQPW
jgi:hypothetical protein